MKKLFVLGAVLAGLAASQAASAQAVVTLGPNVMRAGVRLNSGQNIQSINKNYMLAMQTDGNLVLYAQQPGGTQPTGFSTGKGGNYAVQQDDGNFVVYTASNTWRWTSETGGRATANYVMVLGDDGRLTIREPVNYNVIRELHLDRGTGDRQPMRYAAHRITGGFGCEEFYVVQKNGVLAAGVAAQQGGVIGSCDSYNKRYLM